MAGLAQSLKCAVSSTLPPMLDLNRQIPFATQHVYRDRVPDSRVWSSEMVGERTRWESDEGYSSSPESASSSSSTTSKRPMGSNNWSSAVPLPRLALLSGLTTVRLSVSLTGFHARVLSKGLHPDHDQPSGSQDEKKSNRPSGEVSHGRYSERYLLARTERACRCVRRVARQLLERIHPAAASPGYREACRLFRDEMRALGYKQSAICAALQALVAASERLRESVERDEGKTGERGTSSLSFPSPPRRSTSEVLPSVRPTLGSSSGSSMSEEDGEVRELVEAGMAALSNTPESERSGDGGWKKFEMNGDQLQLDIASVEVRRTHSWLLFSPASGGLQLWFEVCVRSCWISGVLSLICNHHGV